MAMSEAEYLAAMEEASGYVPLTVQLLMLIEMCNVWRLRRQIRPDDSALGGMSKTSPRLNRQILSHVRRAHDLCRNALRSVLQRQGAPARLRGLLIELDADGEALMAEDFVMAAEELLETSTRGE